MSNSTTIPTNPRKQCRVCKAELPLDRFSKSRVNSDGLRNDCKGCDAERKRIKSLELKQRSDEQIPYPNDKKCTYCKQVLPADKFSKNRSRLDGLHNVCRDCNSEYERDYRKSNWDELSEKRRRRERLNPEMVRARRHRWEASHPEQHRAIRNAIFRKRYARKVASNGQHSAKDVELQFQSQKGLCWWCGLPLDPNNYHVDHRIPLAKGGSNDARNICIAHPKCNQEKHNKMPWEYNGRLL